MDGSRETPHDVAVLRDGDTAVVRLAGEIDVIACDTMRHALRPLVDVHQGHAVVIDMAEVTFIDSTGLSCLLQLRAAAQAAGTRLHVRNPSERVVKVLDLVGLRFLLEEPGSQLIGR